MWKKIFKKAKTTEGTVGIGGAIFGGWLGSSMGIAAPSLIPSIFGTAISGLFPVAAVGALVGYLGVKTFKHWKLKREIEEMKKKYRWLMLLKQFYNFSFLAHFLIIFLTIVFIVGWSTICASLRLPDFFELLIIFPLIGLILLDIICIIAKIFKRSFEVD